MALQARFRIMTGWLTEKWGRLTRNERLRVTGRHEENLGRLEAGLAKARQVKARKKR